MKIAQQIGWIAGILLILAFILYPKLSQEKKGAGANPAAKSAKPQAIRVKAYILKPIALDNQIKIIGTILANEEVELHSEISGRIIRLYFAEGTGVGKGQLLLKINDADLQAQLKKAQSQNKLALNNEKRLKLLLEKEGISQADYEVAVNQLNVAGADIEYLVEQIRKTEIRAPFHGKIGLKYVSEGAYINPQTRIAGLQDLSQVKVEFSIPERYASQVKTGNEIEFKVENNTEAYRAKVYAIDPKIDLATRNLTIRAVCANADNRLFAGSFAEVQLNLDKIGEALLVPSEAVVPQIKGKAVFLAKNGKAILQPIKTGLRLDKSVQVIEGVQQGDTILTSGILQLKPDAPIQIVGF
jgi:membrane fusion protein (multidrug efflux system)